LLNVHNNIENVAFIQFLQHTYFYSMQLFFSSAFVVLHLLTYSVISSPNPSTTPSVGLSNPALSRFLNQLNWASTDNPIGEVALSRVKNQGLCGACWAFVAVAAVEACVYIKTRRRVTLSVQQLVDCDRRTNKGCNGGDPFSAFNYIVTSGIS